MSFRLYLQNAIYARITEDTRMISLWPDDEIRADTDVPPNLQFPYIVFGLKKKRSAANGDDFTANGKLYIDLWMRRPPTEDNTLAYAISDRIAKLFNKKMFTWSDNPSYSARFWYVDDFETPVTVDGNVIEPELKRYTVEFDARIIDPSWVDAIINED